jgi:hypothetical protein
MKVPQVVKRVLKEADKHSPIPMYYDFSMEEEEKALFDEVIKPSKAYLEFGMGGSTLRALRKSNAIVYSIDSSSEWLDLMREYTLVRQTENKRLFLYHVGIGKTGKWGKPEGDDSRELFPNYSASIFSAINKETIDTVLVDGRFRVACTLKTILECHGNDGLQIMIHDFWRREAYHVVLKYLDELRSANQLGVFKVKEDIALEALSQDYEKYKYIPV